MHSVKQKKLIFFLSVKIFLDVGAIMDSISSGYLEKAAFFSSQVPFNASGYFGLLYKIMVILGGYMMVKNVLYVSLLIRKPAY